MVKSFLNLLNSEINGVHQAAYLLGFFAVCSQILALIRDRIFASQFGAGEVLDLYYSAFRIPDIIFISIASVVSMSVLIPLLIEKMERDENEAKILIDNVFSFFFIFVFLSGLVAFIFAPNILSIIFPTFSESENFKELVKLTRVLLLSPVFLGLSNLLANIIQIHKRFFIYALSPLVYNIGIIIGAVFFYPLVGLSGLGYGVILGALFHFLIQVPFVKSKNAMPSFRFPVKFGIIKSILSTSLPRTVIASSNEISKLFLISIASFLPTGSIAVFNFSLNLQSVPFSIIGVSYSLATFPTLSKLFTNGDRNKFLEQIIASARHIVFWSVPVTILFIVLRAQIVRTILGSGEFNWDDTRLTAATLSLFVISLLAQNLTLLFSRAYYSQGKTRIPLYFTMFSMIVTVSSGYFFVDLFEKSLSFRFFVESLLKVSDISGASVLMLPLSFSIGLFVNLFLCWFHFSKDFKFFSKPVLKTLFQSFSASIVMGSVTYQLLKVFDNVFNINTLTGIFMQGFLSGILGIVTFIIILLLLKNKELYEIWGTLHKKFWKTEVLGPDAEM